ncbi:hypothetical protein RND71_039608 [Anisodus tanguticus]|uniref:Uncharacterized protein n=1 Tax=Anisodus tanguticus TaxID=243964 RepID=A0AAE1US55_9SOLA|nr:hypothetical protein RND71_039608 [Anisodus tanguticus]
MSLFKNHFVEGGYHEALEPPLRRLLHRSRRVYSNESLRSGVVVILMTWCSQKRGPLFVSVFNPVTRLFFALASVMLLNEALYVASLSRLHASLSLVPLHAVSSPSLILDRALGSGVVVILMTWCSQKRSPLFVSVFNPVTFLFVALASAMLLDEAIYVGTTYSTPSSPLMRCSERPSNCARTQKNNSIAVCHEIRDQIVGTRFIEGEGISNPLVSDKILEGTLQLFQSVHSSHSYLLYGLFMAVVNTLTT